jgi:formiminoglutamate deiminase
MTTYWCEHAQLPGAVATAARVTVEGDRVTGVETRAKPQAGDEMLTGIVLPGFANAHSHVFHRALRGRTHGDGGDFWSWREHMYAVTERLDPDSYLELARAVFAEMVLAGYTAVGEFHYLHHQPDGRPYADPNAMGRALVEAAHEAGMRLTLLDTLYLSGGLTGEGHIPLGDAQRRFGDGSVDAWADRVDDLDDGPMLRVGAAAHSVRAVPRDDLAAFAKHVGVRPVHVHVSEQLAENVATQAFYGLTPTELLADTGVLGPTVTTVHSTHLLDTDLDTMARSGATACFCPTTERDLADGIGPARALHDRGVPLAIGSDQHVVIDPFVEVRAVEEHERLVTNERGRFALRDLGAMGAVNGYRALGWEHGGHLEPGALADFVAVRLDSVRTAGARPDQVVFAAGAPDVTDVVIGGERVVTGGHHRLGPVDRLLGDALRHLREPR